MVSLSTNRHLQGEAIVVSSNNFAACTCTCIWNPSLFLCSTDHTQLLTCSTEIACGGQPHMLCLSP